MSINKKLLRTVEKIGITQRQNLEWLIDFAELEADTPTMRDECLLFISRVTRSGVSPSTELPMGSLRLKIRQALFDFATGKPAELVIDLPAPRVTLILNGDRKDYEIAGRDGSALFLFAASDLLRELRSEISLCAYQDCSRGSLGRRRLFLRNRRARYCCRACANNAASDAFLEPEDRERRSERRKRFIFTCPNCQTESPIAKMLIGVECPNCGKHYLSGSRNTRPKENHDKGA